MIDDESTTSGQQETAPGQTETESESTTPTIGPNDGALPPDTAPADSAGNAPPPPVPSGGDTDTGDVGNAPNFGPWRIAIGSLDWGRLWL